MANGRVTTGFSKPYVALYSAAGTTVTYTSAKPLARGVSVSIAPEVSDESYFYADNMVAETSGGTFTGGTVTLTVDGLLDDARKLIYGLGTKGTDGFYDYGDSMTIPFVGVGFVARVQSEGVVSYVPYVLPKCRFKVANVEASTQAETIDFQTEELEATILRDDTTNHSWLKVGEGTTTEALAVTRLTNFLK